MHYFIHPTGKSSLLVSVVGQSFQGLDRLLSPSGTVGVVEGNYFISLESTMPFVIVEYLIIFLWSWRLCNQSSKSIPDSSERWDILHYFHGMRNDEITETILLINNLSSTSVNIFYELSKPERGTEKVIIYIMPCLTWKKWKDWLPIS